MVDFGVYYSKLNHYNMLFFSIATQYCLAAVKIDKIDLLTAFTSCRTG